MNNTTNTVDTRPVMVSIRCAAYNHEHYIRQCLDGFVMQKTIFRFEAIVHDDASTDGTVAIIREYAEKYPDIIKPIFETENQYSKRDGSLRRIIDEACTGKYFAICEGDDYWTDPLKLQKQIDFLEAHPDCMMTFHRAECKWEGKDTEQYTYDMDVCEDRDYDSTELMEHWIVPCASMVYRREVADYPIKHRERFFSGDDVLYYSAAEMGKVHGFSDVMSVYRVHADSISRNKERENYRLKVYPDHYINIYRNFPGIDRKKLRRRIAVQIYHRMNITPSFYARSIDWFLMARWDFPYAYQYLRDRTNWYVLFPIRRKIKSIIIREK